MNFDEFLKRKPAVDTPNGEIEGVGLDVPMPEQRPAEQELATEGAKLKRRTEWWNEPNYAQAVEAQRKAAMEAAERDVNRAKRERDAALITDMADVFTRMVAQRGSGAWMMPSVENRAGAANEAYTNALRRKDGLAVDYDGKLFQARVQDFQNKRKQQQADREYELAVDKAKRETKQQAFENALAMAKFEAEKGKKNLDILLQQGRIDEQKYKAEKAKIEASYANRVQQSIIAKNNAAQGEYIAYDEDGVPHQFKTAKAQEQYAREHGTWEEIPGTTESVRIGSNGFGMPDTTRTTTTRVIGGRAFNPKEKKKGKTMPGVNNENKKMPGVK